MAIKDWPASERPREKLLRDGATALSDAELLAIIIGSGRTGQDALSVARKALQISQGISALCRWELRRFKQISGFGDAKFAILRASLELSRRCDCIDHAPRQPLLNPTDAADYLVAQLAHRRREIFAALFLDTRHRIIRFEHLFEGTIDRAVIHHREVLKKALEIDASAIIFAHNHPSGDAEPSASDIALTKHLEEALNLIEIKVLDHIVVGGGDAVSCRERGLMRNLTE